MSVHIETGNRISIVFERVNGTVTSFGIQPWGGGFIPIPDPKGLADALVKVAKEIGIKGHE